LEADGPDEAGAEGEVTDVGSDSDKPEK